MYSPKHFALFRVLLGVYLATYFVNLLPYSEELFGTQSFFATAERSGFTFRQVFPSLLDNPAVASHAPIFVSSLAVLAIVFAVGVFRRSAAVLLWYGLTCLINRDPGIMNPSHAFIGWMCLASALIPTGEAWRIGSRHQAWKMPGLLYSGAWWVMATGYSASGVAKLQSPGWLDGSALVMTLDMAYARDTWIRTLVLELPSTALRCGTWFVLGTELLFAPLAVLSRTRPVAWCSAVALHCLLLVLFEFPEIPLGMLLLHVFTFDERWLER